MFSRYCLLQLLTAIFSSYTSDRWWTSRVFKKIIRITFLSLLAQRVIIIIIDISFFSLFLVFVMHSSLVRRSVSPFLESVLDEKESSSFFLFSLFTRSILFISCHQQQSCRKIQSLIISWICGKTREEKMFLLFLVRNVEALLTCFYQVILHFPLSLSLVSFSIIG